MADRTKLSDEALDKFEAFLRRLASVHKVLFEPLSPEHRSLAELSREAQTLVDQYLPAPVDPLVLEAVTLCDASDYDLGAPPVVTNGKIHSLVVNALKRGQELAHAEYEPVSSRLVGRSGLNLRYQPLFAKRDS